MYDDPIATARKWRAIADDKKLSIRDLIIEVTGRQNLIGTPAAVAEEMIRNVHDDVCDGFILVPHLIPSGLDSFVEKVVPSGDVASKVVGRALAAGGLILLAAPHTLPALGGA